MKIEELPDLSFQIRKRASIFQYAKAMGYQTYLFDAQKDTFWLGTSYDQTYVDDWEPVSSFSTGAEFDRDAEVARKINRLINSSTGHFVWVVKRGIHFPYTTNFPVASSSTWQPSDTDETEVDPTTKQQLINTYDNALRYNLDSFFRNLDIEGWRNRTLMVYTSDHGQTLSEHGESYTHCGTSVATSPTEAMVPLFMISKEHLSVNAQFPATHANIFATLLDLMGVQESERVQQYEPSLFKTTGANSRPRYFWVGDLHERSLNGRVLFDR